MYFMNIIFGMCITEFFHQIYKLYQLHQNQETVTLSLDEEIDYAIQTIEENKV